MMRIKKFTGPNIAQSLSLAKAEMGEDALVLQTIRKRKGAESVVEVVAANNRAAQSAVGTGARGKNLAAEDANAHARSESNVQHVADLSVMKQLEEVGLQLNSIMTKIAPPAWDDRRKRVAELRVNLQNAGFDPGLVQRRFLERELAPGGSFEACLREIVGEVPLEVPEERVSIFVGPSGSGKTTALLKVAAMLLSQGIKPRVVLLGTGRTRDAKGLAASCRELGLKFKAVPDATRLAREIMRDGRQPILADTPGITGLKDEDLETLAGLTGTVEGAVIRLVVNAGIDPANICAIASCIPRRARVSLVLTKLDEATRIGGAVSAAMRERIPVAYLTGGRDFKSGILVPDRMLLYERIAEGLAEAGTGGN